METLPAPNVFGNAIFCEDIRLEMGGKITLVGCYSGEMLIHTEFPFVFPKFCVFVTYWQHRDHVKLPIKFYIFVPGDSEDKPSIEFGISDEEAAKALAISKDATKKSGIEPMFATVTAPVGLVNFTLTQPGSILVRAVHGDKLIRLGRLQVRLVSTAAPAAP
jgi:hypothetical protein